MWQAEELVEKVLEAAELHQLCQLAYGTVNLGRIDRQPVLHDVEGWIIARLSVHFVDRLVLSVERRVSAAARSADRCMR